MTIEKYKPIANYKPLDEVLGSSLNNEFRGIALSISRIVDVLNVLARDDSRLANSTVHLQALTGDLYKFIQGNVGKFTLRGQWVPQSYYRYGEMTEFDGVAYGCCQDHAASTDFMVDKAAGYWQILSGDTGSNVTLAYVNTAIQTSADDVLNTVSQIYITALEAAQTYATSSFVANNFLSIASAANTFLTLQQAAQTYATINSLSQYALLNSPEFSGIPTAPTPQTGDVSSKIATTEFVAKNFDAIGNMAVFTSSGTWTVPNGVFKCEAIVVGGGAQNLSAGGVCITIPTSGGNGGLAVKLITGLTSGQSISVTVGNAGVNVNNGDAGGSSSFGSYCSATGGSNVSQGGAGNGIGVGGDVNGTAPFYGYGHGAAGDNGIGARAGVVIVRW